MPFTHKRMREWVLLGHKETAAICRNVSDRDNWWPGDPPGKNKGNQQGWFSNWMTAVICVSADELLSGSSEHLELNKCGSQTTHVEFQEKLFNKLWQKDIESRSRSETESMVDLSVICWEQARPIEYAAEMEASPRQSVNDILPDLEKDTYAWDFWKLLAMPSPRRLLIARVGSLNTATAEERIDVLIDTLTTIARRNSGLLAAEDALAVILFPDDRMTWRERTRLAVWTGEQFAVELGVGALP